MHQKGTSAYEAFQRFMIVEMNGIDVDKWFEGCNKNCDPGDYFVANWIHDNAETFRNLWEVSSCKHCKKWDTKDMFGKYCGFKTVKDCKNFECG